MNEVKQYLEDMGWRYNSLKDELDDAIVGYVYVNPVVPREDEWAQLVYSHTKSLDILMSAGVVNSLAALTGEYFDAQEVDEDIRPVILQTLPEHTKDRQKFLEILGISLLMMDGFEGCIAGIPWKYSEDHNGNKWSKAYYSYTKCIQKLMDRDGMIEEDAVEFFDFNVIRSLDCVSCPKPVILEEV